MILIKYPKIQVDGFGFMPGDYHQIVRRYTITNKNNATVRLISLGAGIQSITIPNKNDDLADVVLGFDNVSGYLKNRYIGRIINRMSNLFTKEISSLTQLEKISTDTDIVNWDSYILDDRVVMTRLNRINNRLDAGYLMIQVSYIWTDENQLHIKIRATSTKTTTVDISNYCLFNLAGHGMGPKELKNHVITINSDKLMEFSVAREMPTGRIENSSELRSPTRLSSKQLFKVSGGGYNHNFCIINPSNMWLYRFHARMLHPASGRSFEVYSNHPTVQLYTGNNLLKIKKDCKKMFSNSKNAIVGKDGMLYERHGCFALVPQGYPKSLCYENVPSNLLYPGKVYVHDITYDFGMIAW